MPNDAERAFEQLRAEVTVMRRVVEELRGTIEALPDVDYSETLGVIADRQDDLAVHLVALAKYAGATTPPERLQRDLDRVRDSALQPTLAKLAQSEASLLTATRDIRLAVATVRLRREQQRAVLIAAASGIALGLLAAFLVVAPFVDFVMSLFATGAPTVPPAPSGPR